jgi:Tyrosine phosphatase family
MFCHGSPGSASPDLKKAVLLAAILLVSLGTGCRSALQIPVKSNATDIRQTHPAPGTSLVRFEEVDREVYKGSKPKSEADYQFLQSKNVKYILNLKFFPFLSGAEQRKAKARGMVVIDATINASPMQPSEQHVNAILCILRDTRLRPIYFHCDLGRDRAALVAALYRVYFRGVPKEEAWQQALENSGFKDDWTLQGLKNYFEEHTRHPTSRNVPDCALSSELTRQSQGSRWNHVQAEPQSGEK